MDPPPRDRFGLADVYGWLGVLCASLCLGISLLCCGGDTMRSDRSLLLYVVLLAAALWTGGYGVVMRGTPVGRGLAWTALIVALGASLLGFFAATVVESFR